MAGISHLSCFHSSVPPPASSSSSASASSVLQCLLLLDEDDDASGDEDSSSSSIIASFFASSSRRSLFPSSSSSSSSSSPILLPPISEHPLPSSFPTPPPPPPPLFRHTSSPSHLLSKLALHEMTHPPSLHPNLPYHQKSMPSPSSPPPTSAAPIMYSFPPPLLPPQNDVAMSHSDALLLRQSSSPACLLSQMAMEEMSAMKGVRGRDMGLPLLHLPPSSSSSLPLPLAEADVMLFDRRRIPSASWMSDWEGHGALSHRKRGRGIQDTMLSNVAQSPENLASTPQVEGFSPPSHAAATSSGAVVDDLDGPVICRARAKRGHATHPRSIAERVRRTKISERIRKLQDLVPNLDKQANTAEMLDEIVEYVKLLQRQIQELSLNHPACNCRHQHYNNASI